MKSAEYLVRLQEMTGLNDTQLAKELEITQPAVSNYKHGKRVMDPDTCLRVAQLLGIELDEILAAARIDSATNERTKKLWEDFLKRVTDKATATLMMGLAVIAFNLFLNPEAKAAEKSTTYSDNSTIMQIMRIYIKHFEQCLHSKRPLEARVLQPASL